MFKKTFIILGLMFVAVTSYAQQGWFWQNPLPQGDDLYSVCFVDANTGWAVGDGAKILNTTDGGSTWNTQSFRTSEELNSVCFADANTGWAVGWDGTILHTTTGGYTSVEEDNNFVELPKNFNLPQNYPNPFNPQTTIQYTLAKGSRVTLKVYNLLGQEITTLVDRLQPSGTHTITWDGKGKSGEPLASGIYFYKLIVERNDVQVSETKKMVLLK
ncbi:MAG: YCF48-related protein [Candidatus Zixiibacteriota bacterium]